MKQIIFLHALNEVVNNKRFINAYTHTVLPLKKSDSEQYHKSLFKLVVMYSDDFISGLNLNKDELENIDISDNWNWDYIEKLITEKKKT